jgi:hypothetical protein
MYRQMQGKIMCINEGKKAQQSLYRSGHGLKGSRGLRLPDFMAIGT